MLSEEDFKSFVRGPSLYRVLLPWWDVLCHYLSIMMLLTAMLGGTLHVTVGKIICVPCQNTSDEQCGGALSYNIGFVNTSVTVTESPSRCPQAFGICKLDLQQYEYIDAVCYEHQLHWFAKFFPYVIMLQTLALLIVSNFWFSYPSISSRLEHFVSILHKCCDSPWTTRALSETVSEQREAHLPLNTAAARAATARNEKDPAEVELLSVLDKKAGEQAKAIFEKVKKLKTHVEDRDIIYHVYMKQIIAKMALLTLTLSCVPYASTCIVLNVDCVVDLQAFVPFRTFRCGYSIATIFWLLSMVYTALVVAYFLTCFYSFLWIIKNSLREYSFDLVHEESRYSDIPDIRNDFAFILHLLDQYNPLLSKRFAVFLSEGSEKKLRQLTLNNVWPMEKLVQKVVRNAQDHKELHLMLLSGIPEAVFEMKELEVLKLQFIPDPRLPQKLTQLCNLKELWLDHCPATVDHMALEFLAENLRILRLKFTDTVKAPRWVFSLRKLSELYLYGNILSEENQAFISDFPKLKKLRVLFIKCCISSIPKVITNSLPSLQKFFLDNEGTQLSATQSLRAMAKLTCLELLNCGLQRIPSSIFSLTNLQEIDLKGNSLKTIDEIISFQHLPRLFTLKLKYNTITYIPIYIGGLETLEQLYLGHNFISSLPTQLFLCNRLYHLDMSHNKLSSIPNEIQDLKRIQLLNLSYNNIDDLPDGLFKCQTLKYLFLKHNSLSTVAAHISELTNLTLLDLRGNQLESLPPELEECQNLRPNGLLAEEGLLNSLPRSVRESLQRTERAYPGIHDTDGVAHPPGCNLINCEKAYEDSGLAFSI